MSATLALTPRTDDQEELRLAAWQAREALLNAPTYGEIDSPLARVFAEGAEGDKRRADSKLTKYVNSFGLFQQQAARDEFEEDWSRVHATVKPVEPVPLRIPRKADGSLYSRRDGLDWAERHHRFISLAGGLTRSQLDKAAMDSLGCSKRTALRMRQQQTDAGWLQLVDTENGQKVLARTERGRQLLAIPILHFKRIAQAELPPVRRG